MKWIIEAVLSMLSIEEVKEVILMLAKKLADSTETEIDNKLVELLRKILFAKDLKK